MNPTHLRKAIGGAAILLGLLIFGAGVIPVIIHFISSEKELFDYLFPLMAVTLFGTLGIVTARAGYQLFRELSEDSLKSVVGIFMLIGALWISPRILSAFAIELPERIKDGPCMSLGMLIVVPLYLFVVSRLLPFLGGEKKSMRDLLGRGILTLMAWLLWMILSGIAHQYAQEQPLWTLAAVIAPYICFRIAAAKLLPEKIQPLRDQQEARISSPGDER